MKTIKKILPLFFVLIMTLTSRATLLWEDATNYPYTNGCIEGQGQWVCYSPATPFLDVLVTNNVMLLYSNAQDAVEAPGTNGWTNPDPSGLIYASFSINVSQLPVDSGDYFFEFRNNTNGPNAAAVCHVFVDKLGTTVPGTFRLGVANFATEFSGAGAAQPPVNYPEDLATNTWYNVVIAYGGTGEPPEYQGATLWINPSKQDYENFLNGYEYDSYTDTNATGNYVYGSDTLGASPQQLSINISDIAFLPGGGSGSEGISNVIAGTDFTNVVVTSLPVIGLQPQLFSTNYSGNAQKFYAVASGVDVTYQWYSQNYGTLSDGTTYANGDSFMGSTTNTLIVTNLAATDTYYCKVTDAYGNTVTSSNAFEYVITTPTAPFFTNSPVTFTTNVFSYADFQDRAFGSGPITYQWYFAPTNLPITYTPLVGSNNDYVHVFLADYTSQGTYYVVASNTVAGGSMTFGPTNTLTVIQPTVATIQQLHNLHYSTVTQNGNPINQSPGTTYYLSTGITVGGYVTSYSLPVPTAVGGGGMGNSYEEYYIQDTNGYGVQIFYFGYNCTNTPPIGSYVTVTGELELFDDELELVPASPSAITIVSNAPPYTIKPVLCNSIFNDLATNLFGTNAVYKSCSMVTFTNCFIYGTPVGGPLGSFDTYYGANGEFSSNHYTHVYFTVNSPYNPTNPVTGLGLNPSFPVNTNVLTIYQFGYDYPYNLPRLVINPFDYVPIHTNYWQITGALLSYESSPNSPGAEVLPSRLADYVTNPPPPFTASVAETNLAPTVSWAPQVGSTYSVYSATNILGPWTQAAYGLGYYPTNGAFTDPASPPAKAKFYYITSP